MKKVRLKDFTVIIEYIWMFCVTLEQKPGMNFQLDKVKVYLLLHFLQILCLFHSSWSLNVTGIRIKGKVNLKFSSLLPLSLDFVKPKLRLADKGSLSPSELLPLDVIYSPLRGKYLLSNDYSSPTLSFPLSRHPTNKLFALTSCLYRNSFVCVIRMRCMCQRIRLFTWLLGE